MKPLAVRRPRQPERADVAERAVGAERAVLVVVGMCITIILRGACIVEPRGPGTATGADVPRQRGWSWSREGPDVGKRDRAGDDEVANLLGERIVARIVARMVSKRILELRHEVRELRGLLAVLQKGELIKPCHDGKARIERKRILVLGLRGRQIRLSTETLVALHLERAQAFASADAGWAT